MSYRGAESERKKQTEEQECQNWKKWMAGVIIPFSTNADNDTGDGRLESSLSSIFFFFFMTARRTTKEGRKVATQDDEMERERETLEKETTENWRKQQGKEGETFLPATVRRRTSSTIVIQFLLEAVPVTEVEKASEDDPQRSRCVGSKPCRFFFFSFLVNGVGCAVLVCRTSRGVLYEFCSVDGVWK